MKNILKKIALVVSLTSLLAVGFSSAALADNNDTGSRNYNNIACDTNADRMGN